MPEEEASRAEEDEDYISAEDEDFAPEEDGGSSASDSEGEEADTKKPQDNGKRKAKNVDRKGEPAIGQEEIEGLMQDAGKRKRKRKGEAGDEYDSGGEGGVVKTRSMAAAHKDEKKKALATDAGATIDVDTLWKSLNDASLRPEHKASERKSCSSNPTTGLVAGSVEDAEKGNDLIIITQTYNFAGQTHTTTTQVPRDSEQARIHLQNKSSTPTIKEKLGPNGKPLIRPLRRVSPFDPNPTGFVKGLPDPSNPNKKPVDSKNKNKGPKHKYLIPKVKQPAKLNVVDKSKLDWTAHVDATGQRDELEAAQKARGNYLEQRDFLERVEGREEQTRAIARTK